MSIRIYSKAAFLIGPGAQHGSSEIISFVTVPGAFQDMPDTFKNDPTFLLAVKSGDITVITGNEVQREVEKNPLANANEASPMDETETFYNELKVLNREEAIKLAEKYGVSVDGAEKLSLVKKRIFEAYKVSNEYNTEE